jgi:hypothetical protein
MKRIKTFALFEATSRSMLRDAFRQEVLGNQWAEGIIGIGCSFDIRSLGFANVLGAGSKTSIYPIPGGGYGHKSISQGVTFGDANYPTLDECLKGLYMYILRKKVKIQGIKKDEVEQAIEQIGADNVIGRSTEEIDTMVRDLLDKPKGASLPAMCDSLNLMFGGYSYAFKPNGPDAIVIDNEPLCGWAGKPKKHLNDLYKTMLSILAFGVDPSEVTAILPHSDYPPNTWRNSFHVEYKYTGNTISISGASIKIPYRENEEAIKNWISNFIHRRIQSITWIDCHLNHSPRNSIQIKDSNGGADENKMDVARYVMEYIGSTENDSDSTGKALGTKYESLLSDFLDKMSDPELKKFFVDTDIEKLVYGGFSMEGYLKKRGWSEEDFGDIELLRRMKKRSKYT